MALFNLQVDNVSWHLGCAPAAAANIIIYWDQFYSKLVTSSQSDNDIINELGGYMDTDPNNGETTPSKIPSGMLSYVRQSGRYLGDFSISTNFSPSYSEIRTQIAFFNRPVLLWLVNEPTYGDKSSHVVAVAGYYSYIVEYMIVHDTWGSTPVNMYIMFNSSYAERTWTLRD